MTPAHKVSDLRIVLLGKTGSGKSATGNTILGKKTFEVADFIKSANKLCEKQEGVVGGKTISIIDTPGLFNTAVTKHQLKAEIEKCVLMSAPGPHVFLLVLKLGVRFTKEERDAVKWIQVNFGKEALCRTIILFTHSDQLKGKPLEEYIEKSNYLMEIVNSCDGRYHSFNNEDRNNQDQVTELLKKIYAMMEKNEIGHYTLKMFKTTQRKKEEKKVKIACGIAVLGIGLLGTVKIGGMITTVISGRAGGAAVEKAAVVAESAVAGEAVDIVLPAIEKAIQTSREAVTNQLVAAVEKALAAAGKVAAEKTVAAVEKAVETAAVAAVEKAVETAAVAAVEKAVETAAVAAVEKAVETAAVPAVEKAVETAAVAAVEKAAKTAAVAAIEKAAETAAVAAVEKAVKTTAVAAIEKAAETAAVAAVEKAAETAGDAAQGSGVAAGAVTGLAVAAAAAGAARAAAAAGKVATSGRVSAVAALAAAVGAAAVTLLSALKP